MKSKIYLLDVRVVKENFLKKFMFYMREFKSHSRSPFYSSEIYFITEFLFKFEVVVDLIRLVRTE